MKLTGDINRVKNKRDSRNQDIEIHVDKIMYITQRKDGRFFQAFDYEDELDTPVVITGDMLARTPNTDFAKDDYTFQVYDKTDDTYTLNPNKELTLTVIYPEEADQPILSALTYAVTVTNKEFDQIKRDRSQEKKSSKKKDKKRG